MSSSIKRYLDIQSTLQRALDTADRASKTVSNQAQTDSAKPTTQAAEQLLQKALGNIGQSQSSDQVIQKALDNLERFNGSGNDPVNDPFGFMGQPSPNPYARTAVQSNWADVGDSFVPMTPVNIGTWESHPAPSAQLSPNPYADEALKTALKNGLETALAKAGIDSGSGWESHAYVPMGQLLPNPYADEALKNALANGGINSGNSWESNVVPSGPLSLNPYANDLLQRNASMNGVGVGIPTDSVSLASEPLPSPAANVTELPFNPETWLSGQVNPFVSTASTPGMLSPNSNTVAFMSNAMVDTIKALDTPAPASTVLPSSGDSDE